MHSKPKITTPTAYPKNIDSYLKEVNSPNALREDKEGRIQNERFISLPFTNKSNSAELSIRKTVWKAHSAGKEIPCDILIRNEAGLYFLQSTSASSASSPQIADGTYMYVIIDHPENSGEFQFRVETQSHYRTGNGSSHAYVAGFITFSKGVITNINNDAGGYHYIPRPGLSKENEENNLVKIYISTAEVFARCCVDKGTFCATFTPASPEKTKNMLIERAWKRAKDRISYIPPILKPIGPHSPRQTMEPINLPLQETKRTALPSISETPTPHEETKKSIEKPKKEVPTFSKPSRRVLSHSISQPLFSSKKKTLPDVSTGKPFRVTRK